MAGYSRQDLTDEISDGSIIEAAPLDSEFNAVEAAFSASSGHRHNGTSGEGAPITVIGPAQDFVVNGSAVLPKTDNTLDLGSTLLEFKNLYIDGVANIDSLVADTADINAGTIDATTIGATTPAAITGTTITGASVVGPLTGNVTGNVVGNVTGNLVGNVTGDVVGNVTGSVTGNITGNAGTATTLQTARNIALGGDVSGTASFNGSSDVTITAVVADNSHNHTLSNISDAGTMSGQNASSVVITGGSITGITPLPVTSGGTGVDNVLGIRTVIGLGSLGLQNALAVAISGGSITGISDLAVADGGTGASDAAGARTNLGAQQSNATLTNLSGLSLSAGDILYATGANTLQRLSVGTATQELRVNAGATAPEWVNSDLDFVGSYTTISGGGIIVTNLGAYKSVIIIGNELTASLSAGRVLQVSADNGSTWLLTDYMPGGSSGAVTEIAGHSGSSTAGRSPRWRIEGFNKTWAVKPVETAHDSGDQITHISNASAFNAIKVFNSSGDITGGTVYVFGKLG